jgi:hypothetical protein
MELSFFKVAPERLTSMQKVVIAAMQQQTFAWRKEHWAVSRNGAGMQSADIGVHPPY